MTEGKELDKLYEYGSKLLDSIERDFQSEIQKTDRLKREEKSSWGSRQIWNIYWKK